MGTNYTLPLYGLKLVRERSIGFVKAHEPFKNSVQVALYANRFLKRSPIEQFLVFYLDNQNTIIGMTSQKGTVNQTAVYPDVIFKTALLCNAVGLLFAHNHPSGLLKPSPEDIRLNQKLGDGAKLLGLSLLDHLIVDGLGNHYSFHEAGML